MIYLLIYLFVYLIDFLKKYHWNAGIMLINQLYKSKLRSSQASVLAEDKSVKIYTSRTKN